MMLDLLTSIYDEWKCKPIEGAVASYIPELALVPADKFAVYVYGMDGVKGGSGVFQERFSIQSIAKVLSMTMAYSVLGEKLWERVGVEPSGNPFNSLVQLEYEHGIPRNPLINAGAIVVADVLCSLYEDPEQAFLDFIQKVSGLKSVGYDLKVANSEKAHGHRNAALIHFMKSYGNIHNDPEVVLDFYFKLCSVALSCEELTKTFAFFANGGVVPYSGKRILTESATKRLNAVMLMCGFYDEAGEFAYKVGLPGKSGVGGGIVAIHPGKYVVAVWSPPLNANGNSARGIHVLEDFTTKLGLSIF